MTSTVAPWIGPETKAAPDTDVAAALSTVAVTCATISSPAVVGGARHDRKRAVGRRLGVPCNAQPLWCGIHVIQPCRRHQLELAEHLGRCRGGLDADRALDGACSGRRDRERQAAGSLWGILPSVERARLGGLAAATGKHDGDTDRECSHSRLLPGPHVARCPGAQSRSSPLPNGAIVKRERFPPE